MKTRIYISFLIIFTVFSCKSRVVENTKNSCEIIRTKNNIEVLSKQDIKIILNDYQGSIKEELNDFFISNHKYDFFTSRFDNNQETWEFRRLYFDEKEGNWCDIKQNKKRIVNIPRKEEKSFKNSIEGGFLIKPQGVAMFYQKYFIKYNGVIKTELVSLDNLCDLSNTLLNDLLT